ncbi:10070_t:CDS:1, partial [Rhizophagus irregularis]
NAQSDQEEKFKINISSQSYMDDVTWITKSKAQLEQILKIADEFNIMNNIQTNYD